MEEDYLVFFKPNGIWWVDRPEQIFISYMEKMFLCCTVTKRLIILVRSGRTPMNIGWKIQFDFSLSLSLSELCHRRMKERFQLELHPSWVNILGMMYVSFSLWGMCRSYKLQVHCQCPKCVRTFCSAIGITKGHMITNKSRSTILKKKACSAEIFNLEHPSTLCSLMAITTWHAKECKLVEWISVFLDQVLIATNASSD